MNMRYRIDQLGCVPRALRAYEVMIWYACVYVRQSVCKALSAVRSLWCL
jgi:hypothetical protein